MVKMAGNMTDIMKPTPTSDHTPGSPPTAAATRHKATLAEAATAQINYKSHSVAGIIARENIQDLPLNGRSSLQLAILAPKLFDFLLQRSEAPAGLGMHALPVARLLP